MTHTLLRYTLLAVALIATTADAESEQRIVSLVPSFTETIFALGAHDQLVAVSTYCDYPPQAKELPVAGGFLDPNYEIILSLEPTLVLLSSYRGKTSKRLEELGIPSLALAHNSLEEIFHATLEIGRVTGKMKEAEQLVGEMRESIASAAAVNDRRPKKRVLLVIGRDIEDPVLREIYAAGPQGFLHELLEAAGGINVLAENPAAYPVLTAESIIELNPDLIIEIMDDQHEERVKTGEAFEAWERVPALNLVEQGRVKILCGDHYNIPGPRLTKTLGDLARVVHGGKTE